jgi:uracil-DNA glycosylase family 4
MSDIIILETDPNAKTFGAMCSTCTLRREPFVPSSGPEQTQFGVIGIAPGQEEVRQGEGFVGPSGKLLNPALEEAGLSREELFVTNAVLCKTPANREPTEHELACCRPRLIHELRGRSVVKILAAGKTPRVVLLPQTEAISATDIRGAWRWSDEFEVWVLSTWHPAYILRGNAGAYQDLIQDCHKFVNVDVHMLPEVQYIVIEDHATLARVIQACLAAQKPIRVDTETSNRDNERSTPGEFWNNYILCVGFHWSEDPNKAFIIPKELWNNRTTLELMRPLFENPLGVYGHNIKFDYNHIAYYYKVLGGQSLDMKLVDDTYLMSVTLDERRGGHSLKDEATYWYNAPDYEKELHKYLKKPKVESYSKVPVPVLHKYLAYDIQYSGAVKDILTTELQDKELYDFPYRNVLARALPTIARMEFRGMRVDFNKLAETQEAMETKVAQLKRQLQEIADEYGVSDLNPNSPQQLSKLIYNNIGLKTPKGRKIKEGSTNKDALNKLKGQHPILAVLTEYRRWNKLLTTYVHSIPEVCDPQGYAHYNFNQGGTETGRISGELALTMPRKFTPEGKMIRDMFVVEDDEVLVAADFSQAELRWMGWFSEDPFLHEVYSDPNRDLHTESAIAMYGPDYTKEQRIWAKMLNFAFAYSFTSSENSFSEDTGVPVKEAKEIIALHSANMAGAIAWKKAVWEQVKRNGFLRSPVGRMRRFPLITWENEHSARNEAVNFLPQGLSSDATLWGFCNAEQYFHKMRMDVHPFLFLHDGTYVVCKDKPQVIHDVAQIMHDMMLSTITMIQQSCGDWFPEYKGRREMPFKIDLEVGKSWGALEDYHL